VAYRAAPILRERKVRDRSSSLRRGGVRDLQAMLAGLGPLIEQLHDACPPTTFSR